MRGSFRLALVLLLFVAGIEASGQERQVQTILFVCEHGSGRSVIAAAHFNRLAEQKGLPYHAVARGTNPDPEIPQQIKLNLAKDGVDVPTSKPQLVSEKDARDAARIVTFGCKLPFAQKTTAGKLVDWRDVPSPSEDYNRARSMIVDRIAAFVEILTAKGSK